MACGYGINHEYGLFRQDIDNGYQKEKPDNWLAFGAPWEIERPDEACLVPLYGRVEHGVDRSGQYNPMWLGWEPLIRGPPPGPPVGVRGGGGELPPGQELRLVQEYFLVACTLRDIVGRYQRDHGTFDAFPTKVAIHLNDTHPALAVAELMRILVDERDLPWDRAWDMTQSTMGYTNHTLLPEALEKWPVSLLEPVAPRPLPIIHELNRPLLP